MKDNAKKNEAYRNQIWIMFIIHLVFTLLLLTVGIISLVVGNTFPKDTDAFIIVGKNSQTNSTEETVKWENQTRIDLFKINYVNDENVTTVASANGDKIFAPGAVIKYTFTMLNNANISLVYEVDVNFILKIGNEKEEVNNFPFKVRLYNDYGDYLIGSENEWEYITNAEVKHLGNLGTNSYENYNLEICWEYDGENDDFDTQLGDYSSEKNVTILLEINSSAEESLVSLEGGTKIDVKKEYVSNILSKWLWFILLIINILILVFFYLVWFKNYKRKTMLFNEKSNYSIVETKNGGKYERKKKK